MKSISEHGAKVELSENTCKILGIKQVEKKCQLQFSRAVVLSSLSVLIKQTSWKLAAFDAIQDFGLAGIQWCRHLGSNVKIFINVKDQLKPELLLNLEKSGCEIDENLNIVSDVPQAHLHKNKYTFINIEVCGSAVMYFDALMNSIKHGGLLCVTCTDTSILQNKRPATAQRLYESKLWKTEYGRELGVRVILANLARAAARWSKGLKIELCVGLEHGFTVVCRVYRGSQFGEKSITSLQFLAHCQVCQARKFIPDSVYVQDNVTVLSLCDCSSNGIKAPILQLGPIWSGAIYGRNFLFDVLNEMHSLELGSDNIKLVHQLIVESACCTSNELEAELIFQFRKQTQEENSNEMSNSKKRKLNSNEKNAKFDATCISTDSNSTSGDLDINSDLVTSITAFYYDIQNHSVKGCNPPPMTAVINKLREAGHSASKSHFGPRCIRTSASLKDFNDIILQISKLTKK